MTTPDPTPQAAGPCPFCGGRALPSRVLRDGYESEQDDPDAWAHVLRCHACGAQGGWAKSASGAVRWWNMRAERDTLTRDLAAARAERDALAEALRALIASAEGREEAFVMAGDAGNFEGILDHLISAVVTDNEAWNKARAALARLDSEGKP